MEQNNNVKNKQYLPLTMTIYFLSFPLFSHLFLNILNLALSNIEDYLKIYI